MADAPDQLAEPQPLQFDRVEPLAEPSLRGIPQSACAACKRPIADQYYAVGSTLICPGCREAYQAARAGGSRAARLGKATLFGIGGGLAGAVIWFAVRKLTGYEIGLIAIVVGLLVGKGVRAGSGGRGGRGYQVLAVVLTYFAICANYMPDLFQALVEQSQTTQLAARTPGTPASTAASSGRTSPDASAAPAPTAGRRRATPVRRALALFVILILVFGLSLAAPVLAGFQNLIGLLIIGFALWEAWKINSGRRIAFTGPFSIAGSAMPPSAAGARA